MHGGPLQDAAHAEFAAEAGTFSPAERKSWIGGDDAVDGDGGDFEILGCVIAFVAVARDDRDAKKRGG